MIDENSLLDSTEALATGGGRDPLEALEDLLFKWMDAEFAYRYYYSNDNLGGDRSTGEMFKNNANYYRKSIAEYLLMLPFKE